MRSPDCEGVRAPAFSTVSAQPLLISLILRQFLEAGTQFGLARAGLLNYRGRRILHEWLVAQPRFDTLELFPALLELTLRTLDLLPRDDLLRELDGHVEAGDDIVMRAGRCLT